MIIQFDNDERTSRMNASFVFSFNASRRLFLSTIIDNIENKQIRVSSPLIDEIFVFKDHIHIHFHSSISSQSES